MKNLSPLYWIIKISAVAACILSIIALPGCSDDPSSLGVGLIPQEDFLNADTITAYSTTERSYLSQRNLGSSQTFAVGRSGSLTAEALIKFLSIPDTMKESTVNSVELILFPNYIAGDSTGTFSFNVYKVTNGWTESGFTWDSLTALTYDGTSLGAFSGAVTDSDSVVVSLSPQLLSDWFTDAEEGLSIYGLILRSPGASGPGTVIRGFNSFESSETARIPRLRIIATKNSVIDTFDLESGYDTFVLNGPALVDPGKSLYVHPTLGYSGMLVFDVSAIPHKAVVHRATMELSLDPRYSFYSRPALDSVIATFIVDSMARSDLYDSNLPISERSGNVYTLNISRMVQRWANGFPNQGVRIKSYDDYIGSSALGGVNPFVFYNSQSDASLRPRLKIIYSTIR